MIGLLGGTFDPVHFGHLRPALEVAGALALEQVRFIPCFLPVHRGRPGATPLQRLEMLRLALEGVPGFVADPRELERGGPSYMVDTLEGLRAEVGAEPLALILGQDAFATLDRWHRWERLTELAHLVVTRRPGAALPGEGPVAELLRRRASDDPAPLHGAPAGRIWLQEVTQLDISATAIRREVARGGSCRFLTPEPVRDYIERHGLYRIETSGRVNV